MKLLPTAILLLLTILALFKAGPLVAVFAIGLGVSFVYLAVRETGPRRF